MYTLWIKRRQWWRIGWTKAYEGTHFECSDVAMGYDLNEYKTYISQPSIFV